MVNRRSDSEAGAGGGSLEFESGDKLDGAMSMGPEKWTGPAEERGAVDVLLDPPTVADSSLKAGAPEIGGPSEFAVVASAGSSTIGRSSSDVSGSAGGAAAVGGAQVEWSFAMVVRPL